MYENQNVIDDGKAWSFLSKSILGDVNGLPIKNMVLKWIQLDEGLKKV